MFDPLFFQIRVLALVVGLGALLGLLFDVYRVLRGRLRPGRKATLLGDLLFWAVATVLTFGALLAGNWGEIRLYVWLGCLLGACLYHLWLSRLVIRALVELWTLVAGALGFSWIATRRLARYPVRWGGLLWRRSKAGDTLRAFWRWLRNPPPPGPPPDPPGPVNPPPPSGS
ncbi:MAG: spore cortex biosynthesis protein YabQ [Chitinophagales bacterium]